MEKYDACHVARCAGVVLPIFGLRPATTSVTLIKIKKLRGGAVKYPVKPWAAITAAAVAGIVVIQVGVVPAVGSAASQPQFGAMVGARTVDPPIGISSGPSPWRGKPLRHPSGGEFSSDVLRWANLVAGVMAEQKIPKQYLPGILAQIDQESDGDPDLVNTYDSNAAAGDPSKGLLQVIGTTYLSHAPTKYRDLRYHTVPYTNVWAALRYVIKRYGYDKFASWNAGSNSAY